MSILSWNCHGLETPWAIQFLKKLTLQKRPEFIFLCEIPCRKERVEQVCNKIGFEGMFVVETQGHSGGFGRLRMMSC